MNWTQALDVLNVYNKIIKKSLLEDNFFACGIEIIIL